MRGEGVRTEDAGSVCDGRGRAKVVGVSLPYASSGEGQDIGC